MRNIFHFHLGVNADIIISVLNEIRKSFKKKLKYHSIFSTFAVHKTMK